MGLGIRLGVGIGLGLGLGLGSGVGLEFGLACWGVWWEFSTVWSVFEAFFAFFAKSSSIVCIEGSRAVRLPLPG